MRNPVMLVRRSVVLRGANLKVIDIFGAGQFKYFVVLGRSVLNRNYVTVVLLAVVYLEDTPRWHTVENSKREYLNT